MKRRFSLSLSTIAAMITAIYIAYRILLRDNYFHTSISEIINFSHGLPLAKHILVLGILPIYIAAIVFGAAMLSIYLKTTIQQLLTSRRL